jgi:transposase
VTYTIPFGVEPEGVQMQVTEVILPDKVFNFSGQTKFDTWKLREVLEKAGWSAYSEWLVDELPFCLQGIRDLAEAFPFWQRRKQTGRPPQPEKVLLVGFMVRQIFGATFRATEGILKMFREYLGLTSIPDYSVFSKKNASKRWLHIWQRFHKFVLERLPKRKAVVATDGTGYSGRKRSWRETPYDKRAVENWVKVHATIEIDSFLVLSYKLTKSDVHESQRFDSVWDDLPENVTPVRSLADSAYTGEPCIQTARNAGAAVFHDVKSNAVYVDKPVTGYQKLVHFARHWPNRFRELYGKRAHVETTFSMISEGLGYRIRCRSKTGRKNEIQSKICTHNFRVLAACSYLAQN